MPHALCLTVYLSRNTFLRGEKSKRLIFHDLKITVFFNGELCASTYIPDRYRADSFRMTEHIIRFTGRRVDRLVEKPWVIVPPGQEPNGGLRKLKTNETGHVGAKQRWNSISESLVAESDRLERNERGEHSILGEYISALAQLKMPSDVKDIQKVGGQKFGVIDVVITSGKGHKDDSSNQYLTEPTALRLSHHKLASHQHIGLDKKVKTPIKQYFEIPGINSFGQPTDVIPAQPEEVYLEKPKRVSYQTNSRADADSLAQCFAYDEPRSRAGSAPSIAEKDETSINEPKQLKDSNDPARKFSGLSISHNTQRAVSHSVDNELKEGLSTKTPKEDDCSSTINELKFLVKLSRRTRKAVDTHPSSGSKLLYVNKRSRSPSLPRRSMSVTSSISEKPYVTSFPRVHATHGGPERISSSVQTNFGPKNKRKFSQDKTKQPKTSRARLQYTTVLDNKMTLAEEIASITAEAEKGKTMPISGKYPRLTRSALAKTETEAIFPDAPVNHAASEQENTDDSEANKPPKKIIKLSIPSLKYHIPPEKLASSSPTMAPLTPTIGHVCLPSPISDSQPISSASQAHHAAGPAPSHENWKKIFGPGSLSDDSVLTYAPHGVLRPVRAERSGWFEETGVVMGVRFLVG